MFPMMDPEKMKPMEEDEAVKKMANIGAIMEGAGASFGEEEMCIRDRISVAVQATSPTPTPPKKPMQM